MTNRLLILRNILKCWALLAVIAALFGLAGWRLGDYRLAILFGGSIVLLASAIYAYADRIVMGMLGARELLQGESPLLHSTVERLASRAGVVKPRLYVLPDGYPRALSAGPRRRRRLWDRALGRAARRRVAGRARGDRRARARPPTAPRRPRPIGDGRPRDVAARAVAGRRRAPARPPRPCSARCRRRSST